MRERLFGKTLEELQNFAKESGLPAFAGRQLADWLYNKKAGSFAEMTNLSKKARELLEERYDLGLIPFQEVQVSGDGTKKYLFPAGPGKFIETAFIPDDDRQTLCVSSQVGCKMGCLFCMTAKQGFQANLTSGEIINQLRSIPERDTITNIVYMGMGEPFDNTEEVLKSLDILTSTYGFGMSHKRITVSTIGVIPGMKSFLERSSCHLAISLHTPFDEERRKLMPVQHVYPIRSILEEVKKYDLGRQRRVSFEYILFKGINDTPAHVRELVRLLSGLNCRINLIRFHPIPGTPLESSPEPVIEDFRDALNKKGIMTTIRRSRGQDIYAACGLLSTKSLMKKSEVDTPDF
jgi:23S rRNA (adenine2503-C2)-methyltransferase